MTARCCHAVKVFATVPHVSQSYKFRRGDRVVIVSGSHRGTTGTVESLVFQRTVDYPNEFAAEYHVVIEDRRMVTVRWDQVGDCASNCSP